jgi:hypothetical protein
MAVNRNNGESKISKIRDKILSNTAFTGTCHPSTVLGDVRAQRA